jgi:hypothetical protein
MKVGWCVKYFTPITQNDLTVRSEVLKGIKLWIVIFPFVTSCSLIAGNQSYEETCSSRLQGRR